MTLRPPVFDGESLPYTCSNRGRFSIILGDLSGVGPRSGWVPTLYPPQKSAFQYFLGNIVTASRLRFLGRPPRIRLEPHPTRRTPTTVTTNPTLGAMACPFLPSGLVPMHCHSGSGTWPGMPIVRDYGRYGQYGVSAVTKLSQNMVLIRRNSFCIKELTNHRQIAW